MIPRPTSCGAKVAEGAGETQIRIPAKAGIAGAAFTSGEVLNVPDAYAHPLFNQEIDRRSGFRTRNLLNVPVIDRAGEHLGVVQVLNKRGGAVYAIRHPPAESLFRRDRRRDPECASCSRMCSS